MHPDGDAGPLCMLRHEIILEMKVQIYMKLDDSKMQLSMSQLLVFT
jgi:hypothetical protein